MHIAAFLFLTLLMFAAMIGVLLVLVFRMKSLRISQDAEIARLQAEGDAYPWQRIFLTRPTHFSRIFSKLLPFEARGVLVFEPECLRLIASLRDGRRIDRRFPKAAEAASWVGNATLASGNLHWFTLGHDADTLYVSADTGLVNIRSRQATADLFRQIADPEVENQAPSTDFALEKNPASLAAMLGFFVLVAYAVFDGVVLNPHEAVGRAGSVHAVTNLVAMVAMLLLSIPLYLGFVRAKVPSREALVLTLLLFIAVQFSAWPATKRLDQILAKQPEHAVAYRLVNGTELSPVEPGPPDLDFRDYPEYWGQFKPDSIHLFVLQRGGLGLWQHNTTGFYKHIREYYDSHPGRR